ncbi:MAG TPA: hypothetical protein PKY19_06825 [Oscillospiraceae bacterium]|nr:hypothetical protein [Oscillospiraceae bacterium]
MAITVNNNSVSYVDSTGGTHTINSTTGKETVVHSYSYNSKDESEKATYAYQLEKFNEWHPDTEAGDGTALGAKKAYLEKQAAKEAGETSASTTGSSSLTTVRSGEDTDDEDYQEYLDQKTLLDENLAASEKRRQETYERESGEVSDDADADLRSAYIANRTSQRQLPQVMAAKGLSGGAVKSAFRSTETEYSAARQAASEERDRELASLQEALTQGLEKDTESYTSKLAALKRRYADVL